MKAVSIRYRVSGLTMAPLSGSSGTSIPTYEKMNAAGRFINDARNTQYTNNCTWDRNGLSNEPHAVVGKYYLGVYATRDIMQGEELFMS